MVLRFGHVNPNKFLFGHFLFGCVWLAYIGGMASLALSVILRSNLKEYDSTTCRIERADVRQTSIDSFAFTAEFTYEYGGKTIKATSLGRPNQQEFEFSRLEARLPLLEKYAPGTVHVCRVNRENPSDGVLPVENPVPELGGIWQVPVIACVCIVVTIFLSVGLGMIAFAFPGLRRKATKAVKKRLGGAFAMLFALPFGIIGIGIIASTILTQKEASGFIPVQAKILYSGVASQLYDLLDSRRLFLRGGRQDLRKRQIFRRSVSLNQQLRPAEAQGGYLQSRLGSYGLCFAARSAQELPDDAGERSEHRALAGHVRVCFRRNRFFPRRRMVVSFHIRFGCPRIVFRQPCPTTLSCGHSAHRRIRHPVESHRLGDFAMGTGAVFRLHFPGRRARTCGCLRMQARA